MKLLLLIGTAILLLFAYYASFYLIPVAHTGELMVVATSQYEMFGQDAYVNNVWEYEQFWAYGDDLRGAESEKMIIKLSHDAKKLSYYLKQGWKVTHIVKKTPNSPLGPATWKSYHVLTLQK